MAKSEQELAAKSARSICSSFNDWKAVLLATLPSEVSVKCPGFELLGLKAPMPKMYIRMQSAMAAQ
eukprot:12853-Rhodomonas_salina.1